MKSRDNETALKRAAVEFLTVCGIACWPNNSGCTKIGTRFIRMGVTGLPDITGVLPGGRALAVELKMKGGKVSPEQRNFIDTISRMGGLAFVAYSLDEIETKLIEAGVKVAAAIG